MVEVKPARWYAQPWFLWTIFLAVVLPLAYLCGQGTGRL